MFFNSSDTVEVTALSPGIVVVIALSLGTVGVTALSIEES